jgi:hypothetical protein
VWKAALPRAAFTDVSLLGEWLGYLTQPGPDGLPSPFEAVRHDGDDDGQRAQQHEDRSKDMAVSHEESEPYDPQADPKKDPVTRSARRICLMVRPD